MNIPDAGSLSLGAALLAGLAGSGHCLSMCGGIAGALAMRNSTSERAGSRLALAVAYNVARVASYMLAGALAGLLGRTLLRAAVDRAASAGWGCRRSASTSGCNCALTSTTV